MAENSKTTSASKTRDPTGSATSSIDKALWESGAAERRGSETTEPLLSLDYRPAEFQSRSSSVQSRSRSLSGPYDTHHVSAQEKTWKRDEEGKQRDKIKKLLSYGFMK